ncbi:DNA adenine methylase [bacterium]|nr:DNA adenine methylase [bacterium]
MIRSSSAPRSRRRSIGFLEALPPYLGGKRKLLGRILTVLPRPSDAPVFIDAFLGGGSVSLMAKGRGFRVICNDVALRSVLVGRALIQNDHVTLSSEDVTRLFADPPEEPGFTERLYGGEVIPARHARFLDGALPVALRLGGAKGALLLLLLVRYILALRPMGNFGAKTIVRQMDAGEWDRVNPTFLRDHLARRIESHPRALCEELRPKINQGVFSNGRENEVHQSDVFDFLRNVEGNLVYLDPPYGGTSAYETALKPLDSILAGRPVDATPSPFSGRHALDALDRLLEACAHIPHLVLSYGNAVVGPDELEQLVARHRRDVTVDVIAHAHLAGLASEESRRKNRELLVRAGRKR